MALVGIIGIFQCGLLGSYFCSCLTRFFILQLRLVLVFDQHLWELLGFFPCCVSGSFGSFCLCRFFSLLLRLFPFFDCNLWELLGFFSAVYLVLAVVLVIPQVLQSPLMFSPHIPLSLLPSTLHPLCHSLDASAPSSNPDLSAVIFIAF